MQSNILTGIYVCECVWLHTYVITYLYLYYNHWDNWYIHTHTHKGNSMCLSIFSMNWASFWIQPISSLLLLCLQSEKHCSDLIEFISMFWEGCISFVDLQRYCFVSFLTVKAFTHVIGCGSSSFFQRQQWSIWSFFYHIIGSFY